VTVTPFESWFGPVVKHPWHPDQKVHAGSRAAADALLARQRVSVPPAKVGAALAAIQDSDAEI